jgi:hypothetical protein
MRSLRTAACATVLVAVTACGIPYDDEPRALEPREVPLPTSLDSPVADPDGDVTVGLYFVREGQVELVPRAVEGPVDTAELVELLVRGPAPEEKAAGLISVVPPALTVEDVTTAGSTAVLTLGGPDSEVQDIPPLAFAQIVATVTPRRAAGVRFRLRGRDLAVPQGDGSLTAAPVSRLDYRQLITAAPPSESPSAAAGGASGAGPPPPTPPAEPPPA